MHASLVGGLGHEQSPRTSQHHRLGAVHETDSGSVMRCGWPHGHHAPQEAPMDDWTYPYPDVKPPDSQPTLLDQDRRAIENRHVRAT